jgi:putative acetyltransferase
MRYAKPTRHEVWRPFLPVRSYSGTDAALLADLYKRSVEFLGARDYTSAQVDAWAALCPSPERLHGLCSDGRMRLVAVDRTDRPVAFVDLEKDGHIHFLYCAPEAAGTGTASGLYDAMEAAARDIGMTRLYSEASEAARRFFLKKGFVVTAKREFEISGVRIHNYAVEKALVTEAA